MDTKMTDDWVAPQLASFAKQVREQVYASLDEGRVLTVPELRKYFPGTTPRYLRAAVEVAGCNGLLGTASPPEKVMYTDDAILDAIRRAHASLGDPEAEITGPGYDHWLEGQTGALPSRVLIIQRIGSWAEACHRAGVPCRAARRTYEGFSDDDLMQWIYSYADDQVSANQSITFAGYTKWAKVTEDAPSGSLIKARFFGHKSWNDLRDDAILNTYRTTKVSA